MKQQRPSAAIFFQNAEANNNSNKNCIKMQPQYFSAVNDFYKLKWCKQSLIELKVGKDWTDGREKWKENCRE